MKQCPTCKRTYTDTTLTYCLNDGELLSTPFDQQTTQQFGEPETQQLPRPRVTNKPDAETWAYNLSGSQSQAQPQGSNRWPIYLLIVLLSVLVGGGVVYLLKRESGGSAPGGSTNEQKPDADLLFADNFSNAALSNDWQVVSGDWSIKDGALNGLSNRKNSAGGAVWAAVTLNKDLPANYSVSFRTRMISGELSELMLHLSNNKYVRAYLYSIDQDAVIGDGEFIRGNKPGEKGLDEDLESLGGGGSVAEKAFPITDNTWYTVKVTAKDDTYTISVGGQVLVKYTDAMGTLSRGTIGDISNGQMQFDDVRVEAIR